MYLSYTEVERVTRRRMYYVPFIYWDWEGDKKKNVLCTFHILRERGWQEEECIMYLSFTEGERVTRRRMYYVPFIYWGWEGDKNKNVLSPFHILRRGWEGDKKKNVLCTFHILRLRGWQEEECIMYLSYTEIERVTRRRMYYVPFIYWGLQEERGWQEEECIMYLSYTEGERVTRRRMYYVPFIYWGWEGDKNKNVLCTFHILRVTGWQEQECIMSLSYTEGWGERVTRRRMYYVPFIYWGWEGYKKKNVLCAFHILRVRGWEGDKKKNVLCTFHILRLRGWQEEECIMYLSYTEIERVTRRRMYYVPFIYWGWEGDKKKNVVCTFHILRVRGLQEEECIMCLSYTERVRGWQEQKCIMYLSYTEVERVTRRRMYYVPFIYWGWEGDKNKNVLCIFHILRVRGWQEQQCIMCLSYTEGDRVTRTRMYYLPFIYWGREGDKKKNVVCTFHILRVRGLQEEECIMCLSYTEGERVRGWQEQKCIMYLSYTEVERVTRRRMYYVPFIYWGWEGDKNKNVLCIFHILRVRGWQEQQCIMYLSYTEGDRVTRTRMYYVPFIYWGWEGYKRKNVLCAFHILRVRGWEGDKNKNVLCTCHIPRLRGWQEEECIMYLSYTEIERVTRRRMYYVPFIYWGREGDKKKNVLCTIRILSVRRLQEEECIKYLSYT